MNHCILELAPTVAVIPTEAIIIGQIAAAKIINVVVIFRQRKACHTERTMYSLHCVHERVKKKSVEFYLPLRPFKSNSPSAFIRPGGILASGFGLVGLNQKPGTRLGHDVRQQFK
jgi:hypothetical protein